MTAMRSPVVKVRQRREHVITKRSTVVKVRQRRKHVITMRSPVGSVVGKL